MVPAEFQPGIKRYLKHKAASPESAEGSVVLQQKSQPSVTFNTGTLLDSFFSPQSILMCLTREWWWQIADVVCSHLVESNSSVCQEQPQLLFCNRRVHITNRSHWSGHSASQILLTGRNTISCGALCLKLGWINRLRVRNQGNYSKENVWICTIPAPFVFFPLPWVLHVN